MALITQVKTRAIKGRPQKLNPYFFACIIFLWVTFIIRISRLVTPQHSSTYFQPDISLRSAKGLRVIWRG